MSYIRRGITEKSAQTDYARQNPQLSLGTVLRGGSIPGEAKFWLDQKRGAGQRLRGLADRQITCRVRYAEKAAKNF